MKHCTKCKTDKPLDDFPIRSNTKIGRASYCRPCNTKRSEEWQKKNPKKVLDSHLKRKFGITSKQYDKMFKKQGGCCAICGKTQQGRRFPVDHDHNTGEVRGILCHNCNMGLGSFQDDESFLVSAVMYLKEHNV